jgi:hypothetical protein
MLLRIIYNNCPFEAWTSTDKWTPKDSSSNSPTLCNLVLDCYVRDSLSLGPSVHVFLYSQCSVPLYQQTTID